MSATVAGSPAPAAPVGALPAFASARLSAGELAYLVGGVEADLRLDGRGRLDFRPMSLQTNVVAHANGSARLKLEQTHVLAAVNLSMGAPDLTRARCEGSVHCTVEQSAACSVDMEDRAVQSRNALLTVELQRLVAHSHALPLTSLVIIPDKQVWIIHIDVIIIDDGGNVMDAIVMAVKAALVTTTMPPIEVVAGDGGDSEIIVTDDPFSRILLPRATQLPLLISLCKIGGEWILDPSSDEEECTSMRVALAVNPRGQLCGVNKSGVGTINLQAIEAIVAHATDMAVQLNQRLMAAVAEEEERNTKLTAHK